KFSVAEYNIVVLSAEQSTGLERWLKDHNYKIPDGAEPLLRPYIEQGSKWFVAKVDPSKVKFENGMATLSPLRFYYESNDFVLPRKYKDVNKYGFRLTRLKARYGKEVHDEPVFRAVDAIVGGRGIPDENGAMSTDVAHDSSNNFQGRYVILHPWTGAMTCDTP